MHNVANKEMVMQSLWKLKNSDDKFMKLHITEDYTQEERSLIRSFVEKAKVKSQEDSNKQYIWRVRGTPKKLVETNEVYQEKCPGGKSSS